MQSNGFTQADIRQATSSAGSVGAMSSQARRIAMKQVFDTL